MIDLNELKVGDKVVATYESETIQYEVVGIGKDRFWLEYEGVDYCYRNPRTWTKVEPPLIDPEKVWVLNQDHAYIQPESFRSNGESIWRSSLPRIRITSYEVVK